MKNHSFFRHMLLLLALLAGTTKMFATDFYADVLLTSKDTGGGLVYASKTNDGDAGTYGITSKAHNEAKTSGSANLDFYLFAKGGDGVPVWYTDEACTEANKKGEGSPLKVTIKSSNKSRDNSAANPTKFYMKYRPQEHYSKLTVNGENGATVYIATEEGADPAESDFKSSATATKTSLKEQHTYYLFAPGTGGMPMWYKGSTLLGIGLTFEYNVTASSITQSSPSAETLTVKYGTLTNGYVDISLNGTRTLVGENGILYTIDTSTREATVINQKANKYLRGDLTIPKYVYDKDNNRYAVTTMEGGAFMKCSNITGMKVEAEITTLGTQSIKLADYGISIAGGPTTVTASATFASCTGMENGVVDMSACKFTTTTGGMFVGANVRKVVMPSTLTESGQADFAEANVDTLDMRNTALTTIGQYCYYQSTASTGVKYIYVPTTLQTLGTSACYQNKKLVKITDLGFGNRPTAEQVNAYPYLTETTDLRFVSHLSGVTSLGSGFCFNGTNIQSIVLSNEGLTTIPESTFNGCLSLATMVLGKGLTTITTAKTMRCKVHSITYPGSGTTIIDANTLSYAARVFPPALSNLGADVFQDAEAKETPIYFPSTLSTIHSNFSRHSGIKDVYCYSSSTITFNNGAFSGSLSADATLHTLSNVTVKKNDYFDNVAQDIVTSHTRSVTSGAWTTVCMPERAKQPAGATFYTVDHRTVDDNDNTTAIILVPVATGKDLEAGVPYICRAATNGNLTFEYVYGAKPERGAAFARNGLVGKYAAETVDNGATISNGEVVIGQTTVAANGAYIDLDNVPTTPTATAGTVTIPVPQHVSADKFYTLRSGGHYMGMNYDTNAMDAVEGLLPHAVWHFTKRHNRYTLENPNTHDFACAQTPVVSQGRVTLGDTPYDVEEVGQLEIAVTAAGMATVSLPVDVVAPDANVSVWKGIYDGDDCIYLERIEAGEVIPAGTGLLVRSLSGGATTAVFEFAESQDADLDYDLVLRGNLKPLLVGADEKIYALTRKNGVVGLARVKDGVTIPANRAYWRFEAPASAPAFANFRFDTGTATGIDAAPADLEAADNCYDLGGRRVGKPAKGLYIQNGKKILVKE